MVYKIIRNVVQIFNLLIYFKAVNAREHYLKIQQPTTRIQRHLSLFISPQQ